MKRNRVKGVFALVLLSFIFAFYAVVGRYLNASFHIFQQIYLRMFFAFLWAFLLFRTDLSFVRLRKIPRKDWAIILLRSVSFYLVGTVLYLLAVTNTKIGNVAVIGSIPMTAVFGFFLGEKFSWKKLLLIIVAFMGAAIIAITNFKDIFTWGRGEIFALLSVFVFSLSYIARKWQSNTLSNQDTTTLIFFFSTTLLFAGSLITNEGIPAHIFQMNTFFVVVAAALLNVIGLFLTNYGFQHVDNVLAGNILILEAVFGVLLGFFIYREIPQIKEVIGSMVIIASVIILNQIEEKR